MSAYLIIIRNAVAESASYRLNQILSFLTISLPLVFAVFLWKTVFNQVEEITNFDLPSTLTYYLLVVLLQDILYSGVKWEIVDDIHSGGLTKWLTKPISYLWMQVSVRIGTNIPYSLVAFILGSVFVFLNLNRLVWITEPIRWLMFLTAIIMAFFLAFFLSFGFSLVAFWTQDTSGIEFAISIFLPLLSGQILPITFFPREFQTILVYLPWRYTLDFPIQVYLGTLSSVQIGTGFTVQIFWLVALYFIAKILWKNGLNIYQAVGG